MQNEYVVHNNIDYISMSTVEYAPLKKAFGKSKEIRPIQRNYDCAVEYRCGLIHQWHSLRPKMKQQITASGSVLSEIRNFMTDLELIDLLYGLKDAKFSRIDICTTSWRKDEQIHGFLPQMAHFMALNGLCETALKVDKPVASEKMEIETCYIGSRKSRNRIFRCYDKGIDLGTTANRYIRVELETRKGANRIVKDLLNGASIQGLIKRYVNFPSSEVYQSIMSQPTESRIRNDLDIPKSVIDKQKNDSRWHWLMTSVAPALAQAIISDGTSIEDSENLRQFGKLVEYYYNAKHKQVT